MLEAEFQRWVTGQAQARGVMVFHDPDSRRQTPGEPDLLLIGSGLVFAELKAKRGVLSDAQRAVHNRLQDAGVPCYLWAPGDEADVVRALDRIAVRTEVARATGRVVTDERGGTAQRDIDDLVDHGYTRSQAELLGGRIRR